MKLHIHPASAGLKWAQLGIKNFLRQPFPLFSLFSALAAIALLLLLIPSIGAFLVRAFMPAFSLAMMLAAHQVEKEKTNGLALFNIALQSFQKNATSLIILGILNILGFLLILLITSLLDGGEFLQIALNHKTIEPDAELPTVVQYSMLVSTLLSVPLSLIFWHAASLVHWYATSPIQSLFYSAIACWKNLAAFIIYSLIWGVVLFATSVVLLVAVSIIEVIIPGTSQIILMPATIILVAIFMTAMFTSSYITFDACFSNKTDI